MRSLLIIFAFMIGVVPAMAGGLGEPAMDPAVVTAETVSSGDDTWVGILMTLLVFGAAITAG